MGRRQNDSDFGKSTLFILFLIGTISCSAAYLFLTVIFGSIPESMPSMQVEKIDFDDLLSEEEGKCCRGVEHLELWGEAVKWGDKFKVNSSEDCCMACKNMCRGNGNGVRCLCNSWVWCGDRDACGPRFGECWLKRQKDALNPERVDPGNENMWTSGFVFDKGEGVVGLETDYGILRIKLLPDCAPHSVAYILELLALPHCIGCQIYRAESRGNFWDAQGNHIKKASFGPPFALIQGTLESHEFMFKDIPKEHCPAIKRGSVAWVGSGPEFFISLASHKEWRDQYTVFGYVLSEDMEILEKISQLPTKSDVWSNIAVSILENPVILRVRRIRT
ncbi:hypothetical protein TSUD_181020 [Trifolium subterraneum]|uniref:PPIase cyclophilin-type domain-containing protein n=1 Tax=Trifolium subterraneum TaxID=3900 RepID=A0A2Z6M1H8_TRISU|nr:hypothetical protein TSUD_181020 [Trifolium subterraneum]